MSNVVPLIPQPKALDAEQALIGACLLNAEAFDVTCEIVQPADFYEPVHRAAWEAMAKGRAEGRKLDWRLVLSTMGPDAQHKVFDDMTAGQYLAQIAANAVSIKEAPDFARAVREASDGRKLSSVCADLHDVLSRGMLDPGAVATETIEKLDSIVQSRARTATPQMTIGMAAKSAIERSKQVRAGNIDPGITWGLRDLNAAISLQRGQLVIMAARPSMGKTTVGLSVACRAAEAGHGVFFSSLEMGAEPLSERALADLCFDSSFHEPITYIDINAGRVSDRQLERLEAAAERFDRLPLIVDQQAGLTISQIAARARIRRDRMARIGISLDLVVIDHLGLVRASDRYAGARHSELGEITTAAKAMAKELNVAVLLLCQLNRQVESRENKRPGLSDLRESGRIEEDADSVLFLYRESYYLERTKETDGAKEQARVDALIDCQNKLEIIIAKQRQGPTKTVECFVSMPCNALRELDRRW